MSKRIICICCAIIIAFSLSGCQLAREGGNVGQPDELVGVFITTEYVDLFDMEGYLNDQFSSFNGGTINLDYNDQRYDGRFYAEFKSKVLTNEETGEESEMWEYVFENLDGEPFFIASITDKDGFTYSTTSSNDSVCDSHATIGDNTTLEGTIYVNPNDLTTVYINPVYQSGDNRIYLKSGQGMLLGEGAEGDVFTQSIEEKHTITENGEKKEKTFKATISVAAKNSPSEIDIIQMGAEHTLINRESYNVAALPEKIKVNPEVEYIIAETRSVTDQGEAVTREMLDSKNSYYSTYKDRGDGIFKAVSVDLIWD